MSQHKGKLMGCGLLLAGLAFAASWPVSSLTHYVFREYQTYGYEPVAPVAGVELELTLNSLTVECRSVATPLIESCVNSAPYTVILQLEDPQKTAGRARIHAVALSQKGHPDIPLSLQSDDADADGWYPFFDNAGSHIVHTSHGEDLNLPGQFDLTLDISIERRGQVVRETRTLRFSPKTERDSYLYFLTV
jgi:hypothetical protein